MNLLLDTPAVGILITIMVFQIGLYVHYKSKLLILHPLLTSIVLLIVVLVVFDIPVETYRKGGDLITFFLGPATIVLAVPLYKHLELLKKHAGPILLGVFIGAASSICSVILLGKLFNMESLVIISLAPKSVTNPIGVEITRQLGGNLAITVLAILLTGIVGAVIAPHVCRVFRIKNSIAIGLAIGTASHAVGTSRALGLGEIQGAMSGLAIGLSGLFTVLLVPMILPLLM